MKIDEEVAGINICTKKLKTVSENMGHSETIWHAQPKNLILAEVFHMFQNCKILYRLSEEKKSETVCTENPRRGTEKVRCFNFVFYIVGECISCAADTHLATDLTC